MIHVQIASQLTSEGVHGVRWVLLEAAEPPPAGPAAEVGAPALPAFAAAGTAPAAEVSPEPVGVDSSADSLRLRLQKVLVVALGLGAALWTAAVQIGLPGRAAAAAPGAAASAPAAATVPAAPPASAPALDPPATPAPDPTVGPSQAPASAAPRAVPAPATQTPTAAPVASPEPPAAPASGGLPRLTASL